MLLAFVATVTVGWRHIPPFDTQEIHFLDKYEDPGPYNVVLLGDSRVAVGLDPNSFERAIPGAKCINFGFFALGYSDRYFHRVNRLLAKRPSRSLVVLAVDAGSLTSLAANANGFTAVEAMTPIERWQVRFLGPHWRARDSFTLPHRYLANGWVPVSPPARFPTLALNQYARQFANERCSEAILALVCSQIRAWRSQGVKVLALRMPTTKAMFQLETNLIGYNARQVRDAMVEAGASWLELPNVDLNSYDGSHLDEQSAEQVSDLVAHASARLVTE